MSSRFTQSVVQRISCIHTISIHLASVDIILQKSNQLIRFVVMDLCAASLDRLYDKEEIYDGPKPADKLKALLEIAKGVAYIHKEKKVHRDIKPQNILISFDGRMVVADFGCAKATNLSGSCSCSGGFGTRAYLSPEILERTPSDVIKVSIELITRQTCFLLASSSSII